MKKQLFAVTLCAFGCGAVRAQNPAPDTPVSSPVETIELKPHWQAGKKYLQTLRSNIKTSQTIEKQRMDMTQDMTMGMLYQIKDVDVEGAANMELTFRSIQAKFHMKHAGQDMNSSYDSQHPSKKPDPAMATFAALQGVKIQMKMAADGRLLEISGLNEMRNRMLKAIPIPAGAERAAFEALMKKQLSDEAMRKMIEQKTGSSNTYVYPGKPVAIGESWTRKTTVEMPMPMVASATYTLRERANGLAHIDLTSKFSMNSKELSPVKSIKVSTKMSGSQSGTMQLRESDGQIMKMQTSLRYAGTVTSSGLIAPNSKKVVTKSWPIYAKGTMSIESKDLP